MTAPSVSVAKPKHPHSPAHEVNPPAYAGPITLFISGNRDHLAKFITHCKTNKSTTLLVTTNKPTFTHATFANPEAADSVTAFLEEANFNLTTAPAKQSDNAPSTTLTIYMTTGEELSDLPAAGAVEGVITKRSGPSCTVNYPNIMDSTKVLSELRAANPKRICHFAPPSAVNRFVIAG